jgi:hypothetical protein
MSDQLIKYVNGQERAGLADRNVARHAKEIYDETRLAGFKADGVMALAGHIMEGVADLDRHRLAIAGNDPLLNQALAEIEITAIQQARSIQMNLHSGWRL